MSRLDEFVLHLQPCVAALESSLRRQVALLGTLPPQQGVPSACGSGDEKTAILERIAMLRASIADLLSKLRELWAYDRELLGMFVERVGIRDADENQPLSTTVAMIRLIGDFAGRQRRLRAVKALLPHMGGIQIDLRVFEEVQRLTASLEAGSLDAALEWAVQNRSALRGIESTLEFNLRLRECTEIILSGRHDTALDYARRFFVGACGSAAAKRKVQSVLVALLQPPRSSTSLEAPPSWEELSLQLRMDFYRLYRMSSIAPLHGLVQCGIQAINTYDMCLFHESKSHCNAPSPECSQFNVNTPCPVCRVFAAACPPEGLPFAYSSRSQVLCPISRSIIEETAVVAPDGRVFDSKSLLPDESGMLHVGDACFPHDSLLPLHIV